MVDAGPDDSEQLLNGAVFSRPYEKDKKVVIPVTYRIDDDRQYRVVVVDGNGREHTTGDASRQTEARGGKTGMGCITVAFANLSLKDIRRIRLQSRPFHLAEFRNVAMQPDRSKPTENDDQHAVFGPVIERTIHDWHQTPVDSVIDLDSGKLFSIPEDLLPQLGQDPKSKKQAREAWLRANGIDAVGIVGGIETREVALPPNSPKHVALVQVVEIGLGGMDMFATPTADDGWDRLTRAEIQSRLAQAKLEDRQRPQQKGDMFTSGTFPATFLFETREGGMGVLQIIGFTKKPKAVQIRYKLVRQEPVTEKVEAEKPPVAGPWTAKLPKGEIELVAVSRHPSEDRPWWRPDGSPYNGHHFNTREFLTGARNRNSLPTGDQKSAYYEFALRTSENTCFVQPMDLPPRGRWTYGGALQADGHLVKGYWWSEAMLPKSANTADPRLFVSCGDWTPVCEYIPTGSDAVQRRRVGDTEWTVSFDDEIGDTIAKATNYFVNRQRIRWDIRVVAIDNMGQEQMPSRCEAAKLTDDVRTAIATFQRRQPDQFKTFRFEVRPFHTVEFRNVALRPGQKTDAQAIVASPGAISSVRTEGPKATIKAQLGEEEELLLFFGDESHGCATSALKAKGKPFTATVEANYGRITASFPNNAVPRPLLGDRRFVFRTPDMDSYIAVGDDCPAPFGELKMRNTADVTEKDGVFTFCDILLPDGRGVGVSVCIRAKTAADAYQRGIRLATELAAETFRAQRSGGSPSSDALRDKSREFKEAVDELQKLCKGTTAEELIRRCLDLDAARSKVDPGRDPAQWRKIGDEEETASFQLALLMLKAGAAGPIHRQAAKLHFGPWKEVTLLQPAEGHDCGFDFDAGKTLTPPPDVLKILPDEGGWVRLQDAVKEGNAVVRWVVDSGADVVTAAPNELVLLCPVRKQRQIANAALNPDWDRLLTPEYVLWSLEQQNQLMELLDDGHSGALKGLDLAPHNPAELVFFRTRQGGVGVLQVVEFTKNPKGVKIRYKLVRDLAATPPAAKDRAKPSPLPSKPHGANSP
jgi:hypothetical protein